MARRAQAQPTREDYMNAIRQLQAQNQQLAQMVMAERARNAQRAHGSSPQRQHCEHGSLGAYHTLWGGGQHRKNQESYNGSAYKQIRGR